VKVTCITALGDTLTEQYFDPRIPVGRNTDFSLTVGKEYLVYAISFYKDQIWYYVIDDNDLWFPVRKPAPLFSITDNRVSKMWRIKQRTEPPHFSSLIAFDEWISDTSFYERLSDHLPAETSIFQARKLEMDHEFEQE
jgi:hypothetical protein